MTVHQVTMMSWVLPNPHKCILGQQSMDRHAVFSEFCPTGPECLSKLHEYMAETSILSITVLPGPLLKLSPIASWRFLESQLMKN